MTQTFISFHFFQLLVGVQFCEYSIWRLQKLYSWWDRSQNLCDLFWFNWNFQATAQMLTQWTTPLPPASSTPSSSTSTRFPRFFWLLCLPQGALNVVAVDTAQILFPVAHPTSHYKIYPVKDVDGSVVDVTSRRPAQSSPFVGLSSVAEEDEWDHNFKERINHQVLPKPASEDRYHHPKADAGMGNFGAPHYI